MMTKFPPFICGFRRNHSTQYSLVKMIEIWKKYLNKGDYVGVVLMELWKACWHDQSYIPVNLL